MNYKFGIGVISKNIVDACIDFSNKNSYGFIFIPSRRQVDFNGGYVNNWTTKTFSEYIKNQNINALLKRDHGGPKQGDVEDDGLISLKNDCLYLQAIHIDPWKSISSFEEGCLATRNLIQYCYSINDKIIYEVGTEEAIYKYETFHLEYLLNYLKTNLDKTEFESIKYVVIQCGTALKETRNIGNYDKEKLKNMVSVCRKFNLISKEHNGDYLLESLIEEKFKNGLDSINIAPEFGQIETKSYLKEIIYTPLFEEFFNICYNSKKWEKWVDKSFNPFSNKEQLINICGHYVLSYPEFIIRIKNNVRLDIDEIIKHNVQKKLQKLYECQ